MPRTPTAQPTPPDQPGPAARACDTWLRAARWTELRRALAAERIGIVRRTPTSAELGELS